MAIKSLDKSSIVRPQTTNSMLAGYSFQDFELIESVFLASNTASISFNNLNQYATDYSHLQIRAVLRTNYNWPSDFMSVVFNNDTTGYARHGLLGTGSSVVSYGLTDLIGTNDIAGGQAGSNQFGVFIMDILDCYSTTKNKAVKIFGGQSGTHNIIQLTTGLWIDTSAISSIRLQSGNSASIVAGSRFSLYGIR